MHCRIHAEPSSTAEISFAGAACKRHAGIQIAVVAPHLILLSLPRLFSEFEADSLRSLTAGQAPVAAGRPMTQSKLMYQRSVCIR